MSVAAGLRGSQCTLREAGSPSSPNLPYAVLAESDSHQSPSSSQVHKSSSPHITAPRVLAVFVALLLISALSLILLFTPSSQARDPSAPRRPPMEVDLVVVCYDAGETFAFMPVLIALSERFQIATLVMATASNVVRDFPSVPGVVRLEEDVGVTSFDASGERTQELSEADLAKVAAYFKPGRMVLTGLVSYVQRQIAALSRTEWKVPHTVGFVDAFGWDPTWFFARLMRPEYLTQVLVTAAMARTQLAVSHPDMPVDVVGNPSVNSWTSVEREMTRAEARAQLVPAAEKRPIVFYAGGYGASYERGLRWYLEALRSVKHEFLFTVALHPKVDGSLERRVLAEEGLTDDVLLLDTVPSRVAVYGSSVVVSQGSSVGVQSLFIGVPSIFFGVPPPADAPANQTSGNVAIAQKLSKQLFQGDELIAELRALGERDFAFDRKLLASQGGMPLNSTAVFQQWLEPRLREEE